MIKAVKFPVIRVALAGNPNSGKTSLFNTLTRSHQKVGNWSGVTIEKCEGIVRHQGYRLLIVDLPGTYSLTAYTPEEVIAREFLIQDKPDVVINVVDGTALERHLYLTTQLIELNIPMIIALNMADEVEKQHININISQLVQLLGIEIISTQATHRKGLIHLLDQVVKTVNNKNQVIPNKLIYRLDIEEHLQHLGKLLQGDSELANQYPLSWLAVKLIEKDPMVYQLVKDRIVGLKISAFLQQLPDEVDAAIAEDRYAFIRGALAETMIIPVRSRKSVTDILDMILINRVAGLPIFLVILWLLFQLTFRLGEPFTVGLQWLFMQLAMGVSTLIPVPLIRSIVVDGIISGVGGVLGFLPNVMLLFMGLAFLEGSGYMARAAFVVDKIMHMMGLHGKSFIPMITGFGCSIPAIMATRTLKNRSDRLITLMIIPFMSCGAKLPVYILLISAFFSPNHAANILFSLYMLGVFVAILSAKLLKRTVFKGETEPFVMELPPYRWPTVKTVLFQGFLKAKMYLRKAGTTILVASLLLWLASNYPGSAADNQQQRLSHSLAGRMGHWLEPVTLPLGFDWRVNVALVSGLAAKELVVSSLGTMNALNSTNQGENHSLMRILKEDPLWSAPKALALMVFVLLYIPCISALTVFRHEAGHSKWVWLYSLYALGVAWLITFVVYRFALLVIH